MDYQAQATDFAKKNNIRFHILSTTYGKHFPNDTENRHIFKIELSHKRERYTFKFGQSIFEGSNQPSLYSVLSCLQKYDVGNFNNFCEDFGYDAENFDEHGYNQDSLRTYNAVVKEYTNVVRVFAHCLVELREIQ